MTHRNGTLACDMAEDCTRPVTHIGEKGYAYCAEHAPCRRYVERTRKLRPWEAALLRHGQQLPSYKPISYRAYTLSINGGLRP